MDNLQSLMIILAIVIVGVSIAVGLTYYQQQHINTVRQISFSELNQFASKAKTWWNTPLEQGGDGGEEDTVEDCAANVNDNGSPINTYLHTI